MKHLKRYLYVVLFLNIAFLSASCGGGGSDFNSESSTQADDKTVAGPADSDPVASDPVASDPVVSDPVVSDPVVSDPVASDPVVSGPVASDPVASGPVASDPVVSDPVVSGPVVTAPVPDGTTDDGLTSGPVETSLLVDPQFTVDQLPAEAKLWYERLWTAIESSSPLPLDATEMAMSNDLYTYGRTLNMHITSLLQTLRVNGDKKLLDEVLRLSGLMRAELRDWSITAYQGTTYEADGYLNWLYLNDPSYYGTDAHEMDEILTHSMVATMAYAFDCNRNLDTRYAEQADFWVDYLVNHFEAKWRDRKNIPESFPFLTKKLFHVHAQWTRYHYYMYQLTGEPGYRDEALRMADIVKQHIFDVNTPDGKAAQWFHGMPILGEDDLGIQRMSYARYTVHAAADLALEGFSVFAEPGFMEKMATMLSWFVMDDGAPDTFAYRIDGTSDPRETDDRYSYSPYTQLGYWDTTGVVLNVSDEVYQSLERDPEQPDRVFIPAGMFFSLMRP